MSNLTAAGVNALRSLIENGGGKVNGNTAKPLIAQGLIKEWKEMWVATDKAYKLLGILPSTKKEKKTKKEKPALTPLQMKVLECLYNESSANGHDFGLIEVAAEEAIENGVSIYQYGAIVSTLIEKKTIFEGNQLHKTEVMTDANRKKVYKQYILTKYARSFFNEEN